jgi:hypothetical protein
MKISEALKKRGFIHYQTPDGEIVKYWRNSHRFDSLKVLSEKEKEAFLQQFNGQTSDFSDVDNLVPF